MEMQDLEEAIDIDRRAVAITPSDHPDLSRFLNNLGNGLRDRFQRKGEMQDLEEALTLAQISPAARSFQRIRLFKKLENTENEIRKQSGFQRFHLALTEKEIIQLACYGPLVVFNTSKISSDAFIVTRDFIQHMNLPELDSSGTRGQDLKHCRELLTVRGNTDRRDATIIEDDEQKFFNPSDDLSVLAGTKLLWDTAVSKVLDTLGFQKEMEVQGELPHIWWVGGGFMSLLPFHAAGEHSLGSSENTTSRVNSSYYPSLKSLQFVRSKSWKPLNQQESKILVVSMPTTPGLPGYLNVTDEVTSIKSSSKTLSQSQF